MRPYVFFCLLLLCSTVEAKSQWCLQQVRDAEDNLIFLTTDLSYKNFANKRAFPWLVMINISTANQNKNGHPTAKEVTVLNALEDSISAELKKIGEVHFVGRATVKGFRELTYFVRDAEKANAVLAELAKAEKRRVWEYRISKDEAWKQAENMIGEQPECR